jgi:ATP synthase protein I
LGRDAQFGRLYGIFVLWVNKMRRESDNRGQDLQKDKGLLQLPTDQVAEERELQATGLKQAWLYGVLASELAAGVAGGSLAGFFLDRWLGTSPLFTILLLLLGSAGGFFLFLRGLKKLEAGYEQNDDV